MNKFSFLAAVKCVAKGDRSHERRKQSLKESGGANHERLLRTSNEIRSYPAKQGQEKGKIHTIICFNYISSFE